MSLYTRGEPSNTAQFRQNTEKRSGKMEGVCFLSFVCKKCGQKKPIKGRKALGWKAGFKCADC
jgi:hypothetical protein